MIASTIWCLNFSEFFLFHASLKYKCTYDESQNDLFYTRSTLSFVAGAIRPLYYLFLNTFLDLIFISRWIFGLCCWFVEQ